MLNTSFTSWPLFSEEEADEQLSDIKIIEAKDLTDKNQSSSLNQINPDDELKEYM
jgi:hypothetical protein